MSAFACPNAARSLLRLAAGPGSPFAAPRAQCLVASRWLSYSASASRPRQFSCQDMRAASRTQRGATNTQVQRYADRRTLFTWGLVRNYKDLPQDYRDNEGLPFMSRDISEKEAAKIFDSTLSPKVANHLLRILHGRRVAGTLADPAFGIHTAQFTDGQIAQALQYLREVAPVEEVRNAGLRAEDELNQMELEREKRERASQAKDGEALPEDMQADPVYGRSKFDEIRARNMAKQKAREQALEEERLAKEAIAGDGTAGPVAKFNDGKREIVNPRVAEYYKDAQSDMEEPPEMSASARILPSATVAFLIVGFLAAMSMVYEEPIPRYRLFRELSMAQATVGTVIAANVLVFVGWRIPPLWRMFNRYMIFVVATVKPITLFTAVFSHTKLSHMLVNMVPLWFVGNALHDEIGRANFLTLYMGCGAFGFLSSLVTYTLRGWLTVTSLGASGATLGLCSAYFWEHRNDGFKIFGLPQDGVHGIVFLAMITALQLAGLGRTAKLKVDIASHLGGIAAGVMGIEILGRVRGRGFGEMKRDGKWGPEGGK